MDIGSVRKWGFLGLDWLKGRPITRHLVDLNKHFYDPIAGEEKLQRRVTELIEHATSRTLFYRQFKDLKDVFAFPVMQKTTIRKNYLDFFSEGLSRDQLKTTATSGSYGTPLTFYFTPEKMDRRLAEVIFFNKWAGFSIGDPHALVTLYGTKSKFKQFLQNELIIDPTNLNQKWIKDTLLLIKKRGVKFVIGYPSVLAPLAQYSLASCFTPESFNFKAIIATSESLFCDEKILIEEAFGCKVFSRYATLETGVVAHQCSEGLFHINNSSYLVEILGIGKDEPVKTGQVGRVVITDTFSRAFPLIRYDTGDLALLGSECPCGVKTPVLERIEGRIVERIYDTRGKTIHPFAIRVTVRKIDAKIDSIMQFQFVQKGEKRYLIKIVPLKPIRDEEIIREGFKKLLGQDGEIEVEYLETIPPLKSGKRPFIFNEYRPVDI